jgi:protease secretion system membrane fusion protein
MTKLDLVKNLQAKLPVADAKEPDADAKALEAAARSSRGARMGLWVLGIGLGGFLLWAGFAPLDEGVPSPGLVAIDTKRKAVQHLSGGIVKEVLVKEGDRVQEGQVLVKLDPVMTRANYEAERQRYLGLRVIESRLRAEQAGQAKVAFHSDVLAVANDPQIRQSMMNQEQLFMSRRAALSADLQGMEESIQGQEGLITAYDGMLINRRNQLSLITEELNNTKGLVKEGYAPRNRQLELERMQSESTSGVMELQGNTIRAKRAIGELRQRMVARQQEYRKEIESQLTDISREAASEEQKLHAVTEELGRTDIKAPVAGQVVGLAFQTVGGVVGPGQKLMDIVPVDEALLIEAHVAPHLVDKIHTGLPVDVRFSSFANSPQLVVQGKVASISGDLLTEQNGAPYFLARVAVTAEGYKKLGKRTMQPGMPVELVFITGERTMLTYLLHPLTKRLAASMKEE